MITYISDSIKNKIYAYPMPNADTVKDPFI
jgi:hypothetical protein